MKALNSKMSVKRDEPRNATVLIITLDDHDLNRHHLVRPNTAASPVDALAQYALHCLTVMLHETVDEKWERILRDMREGRGVPDFITGRNRADANSNPNPHNKGERAA